MTQTKNLAAAATSSSSSASSVAVATSSKAESALSSASATSVSVPYRGALDALGRIYREEGWRALFAGVQPRVMWISLGGALFFSSFEFCKQQLRPLWGFNDDQMQKWEHLKLKSCWKWNVRCLHPKWRLNRNVAKVWSSTQFMIDSSWHWFWIEVGETACRCMDNQSPTTLEKSENARSFNERNQMCVKNGCWCINCGRCWSQQKT